MPIQETFEDIPHELTRNFPREITPNHRPVLIRNRDNEAMDCMWRLSQNMYQYPSGAYARGSWGYTILRTVYTPESDDLLPSAIAKLEKWLRQYYLHIGRFPMWGEQGEADHRKMADGSINDELGRRFRVELVQDAQRLNLPHLDRASQADICSLCDVFDAWVASVGQDPQVECVLSPRFCDCLAVDEAALRSLAAHPDEPPWLHVCATSEEKRQMRCGGDDFVWLLDTRGVRSFAQNPSRPRAHQDLLRYRGWMRLEVGMIRNAWFERCSRLYKGREHVLECEKDNQNPEQYWYWNLFY